MFRDIRLRALADAPAAFEANLSEARTEQQWRNRISQRAQFVAVADQVTVGTVAGAVDTNRDSVHHFSM